MCGFMDRNARYKIKYTGMCYILILRPKFLAILMVSISSLWIYVDFCVCSIIRCWYHTKYMSGDRLTISAQKKWQKAMTQCGVCRKSASFILIMFTRIKRNMVPYRDHDIYKWYQMTNHTAPWVTYLWYFVLVLKMLSNDLSHILHNARNESLYIHKMQVIHTVIMDTQEVVGNFWRSIKKWCISIDSIVDF